MAKKSTSKLFQEDDAKDVVNETVNTDADIVDIDLSAIKKKRFRINGDDSKIVELNTSDLLIASRLESAYTKLNKMMDEVIERMKDLPESSSDFSEDDTNRIMEALNEIDARMREQVDYIFNSPVSAVCADDGSMWDPMDGSFRYEHIIDKLTSLYENNISEQFAKMRSKVNTRLQDYKKATSKYHK